MVLISAHLVCDNEILMLYFYKVKEVQEGNNKPFMRTFIGKNDYINQDLTTDKTVWKTAALENTDFYYRWYDYNKGIRHYVVGMTLEDEALIFEYMKEYEKDKDDYPWEPIYRFQNQVRDARNKVKQKRETDAIDEVMETLKEVPEDFFKWAKEVALSFSRYLIYKDIGKGMAECYCTHCKGNAVIKRKEVELKNNIEGVCPVCGSKVTCKAKGKLPHFFSDDRWVGYIEKTEDGFVWRYFQFFRNYYTVNGLVETEDKNTEYKRTFYSSLLNRKAYDYRYYKDHTLRWCNETSNPWQAINCEYSCLYPNNLPEAWEHIPRMKYSALEVLSENMSGHNIHFEDAIALLSCFPKLEWLIKMGLSKLSVRILEDSKYRYHKDKLPVNFEGKTIYDILKLSKENVRILQVLNGDIAEVTVLQTAQSKGITLKPSQVQEYVHSFGRDVSVMKRVGTTTLHKILKYLKTEALRCGNTTANIGRDWIDYLKWCEALDYDITKMFYFMPKNLKVVHDRTFEEYSAMKNRVSEANDEEKESLLKIKLDKETKLLRAINGEDIFRSKGFIMVAPKNAKDLKKEGETLGHCVGTYVDQIARGDTQVFFVRKEAEPDTPFYTLEWRDNDICQCQGHSRRKTTPDVEAFTQLFKKKMQRLQRAM